MAPQEKRENVISKCVVSEPKYGEVWESVAGHPRNAAKSTEELLKMVAQRLDET